ncbi:MAG: lipopolysaccharide biosynthesis protein [Chloroflexota bacterium]
MSDQALIIFAGRLSTQILQTLAMALLARLWSREELGIYRQVILVSSLIMPFVSFGLDSSPYYFIPKYEPPRQKAFLWQMWSWQFAGGAIAAAVMYLGAGSFATQFGDPQLKAPIQIFSLFPLLASYRSAERSMLIAMQKPVAASLLGLVTVAFQPLAVLVGAWANLELNVILVAVALLAGIEFVILSVVTLHDLRGVRAQWDLTLLKEHALYSLPLAIGSTLERIMRQADKTIVSILFDTATYAAYDVGALKLPFVSLLVRSIMDPARSRLARLWNEDKVGAIVSLWHQIIRRTSLLILPVTALFFALADPAMVFLYSDKYAESVVPFRLYLLGMPAQIATTWAVLGSMNRTRYIAVVQSTMVIPTVVLGYGLSQWIGWGGAALGLTLTLYLREAIYLYGLARILGKSATNILPWQDLGRCLLVCIVSGCGAYPITRTALPLILQLVIGGAIYLALFGILGYLLRVIQKEDLDQLWRWLDQARRLLTRQRAT